MNPYELQTNLTKALEENYQCEMQRVKLPNNETIDFDYGKLLSLTSRVTTNEFKKIECRASERHGRGVFATQQIQKGELVTLYPADVVRISQNNSKLYSFVHGDCNLQKRCSGSTYALYVDKNFSIVGDPERNEKDTSYLGHFINDAIMHSCTKESVDAYKNNTQHNCDFEFLSNKHLHAGIKAIRDIAKGEELLIAYGVNYWCPHTTNVPVTGRNDLVLFQKKS